MNEFLQFLNAVFTTPSLLMVTLLTLGVILVNGWTDAPNAIATCVSTRSMAPRPAIVMAAVLNFAGIFVMTAVNSKVAFTISKMVDFHGNQQESLVALCAALFAIVVWATAAWWFGIPTSESHALIAGLSGAAIALQNSWSGINPAEWIKVVYGLVVSLFLGFGLGWITVRLTELIFRRADRRKTHGFFRGAQVFGAGAMAFMHGAQDGQKFMGVFLLGMLLTGQNGTDTIPVWMMVVCAIVMGVGTSIGGMKIIKTVGMDMVKLEKYQGFAADTAASGCLLISSLTGLPVSTTHTKTTAIMGVGASKRLSAINWGVVQEMLLAWFLTFPGCGLISYLMVKLFLHIF